MDDEAVCLDLALESTRSTRRCLASEDAEEKDEVLEHLLGKDREIWSEEQAEEYRWARYRAKAEADE